MENTKEVYVNPEMIKNTNIENIQEKNINNKTKESSNLEETLKKELNDLINLNNKDEKSNKYKVENYKNKHILVISGGGIKGIAAIGSLKAFKDLGCLNNIDTYAGTSIGALIGLLLNVGYTPEDLYDFIMMINFSKLISVNLANLFIKFGLDDGKKIELLIKKMIVAKGYSESLTFKELYDATKKKVIIVATCMSDKIAVYYSVDTTPDMNILKAIRMSISVPIYFVPVEHNDKLYIDGGCIDNYPIQLFNDKLEETIGIYLADSRECATKIDNIETFFLNLFQSLSEGITCNSLKGYEKCTIRMVLSGVGIMNMDLDNDKKNELFNTGYNIVMEKFN